MKTIIRITDTCPSTITNADAIALKVEMESVLKGGDAIVLSFRGVTTLTTSFLNSSIGEIVEEYGFDALKGKISLTDYTPAIGKAITDYITNLKRHQHN